MKRIDPFILGIIIFLIVVIIGGVIFAYKSGGKPIQTYSVQNQDHPQVELSSESADLGEMSISDIKSADFIAVMDGRISLMVKGRFPAAKEKMDILSIPDVYPMGDETLVNYANWYYNQGVWKLF